MRRCTLKNRRYVLISTAVVLLLWWITATIVNNPLKLPSPQETVLALLEIITSKTFLLQVFATLKRSIIGFAIAFVAGVVLGIAAGVSTPIFYLLKPIVLTQRSVPTMAVILLALIWLSRELAPILVSVLVIFPIIYSAVVNGIRNIDKQLLEMATVYHLSKRRRLIHLYLPSIRSALFAVAAAAISLNLKITIAAEVLSQPGLGIGTGFMIEKSVLNTAGVIAWAIVAILLGALLEFLVSPKFLKIFRGTARN